MVVVRDPVAAILAHRAGLRVLSPGRARCARSFRPGCRAAAGSCGGFLFWSPEPESPAPTYITRQSGSPGCATRLKIISPSGCCGSGCCSRSSSRAVPSNVALAGLRSVHSISTTSRSILPVNRRRRNRRRGGVARQVQAGHDAGLRHRRTGPVRVLHVHRVEDAVARVVGIDREVGEARREVAFERELREEARAAAEPVEVQVDGRLASSACRGCRAGR